MDIDCGLLGYDTLKSGNSNINNKCNRNNNIKKNL
jgi:hypothetical protein